jgi:hypothetical protein
MVRQFHYGAETCVMGGGKQSKQVYASSCALQFQPSHHPSQSRWPDHDDIIAFPGDDGERVVMNKGKD